MTSALDLRTSNAATDQIGVPGGALAVTLQGERGGSQLFLASGRTDSTNLTKARAATDGAVANFRKVSAGFSVKGAAADVLRVRLKRAVSSLDTLGLLRTAVDHGTVSRSSALQQYNDILAVVYHVVYSGGRFSDPDIDRQVHALALVSQAQELLSQEDALLGGVITAGRYTGNDRDVLMQTVGAERFQLVAADESLALDVQQRYDAMLASPQFVALRTAEDAAIARTNSVPLSLASWQATVQAVTAEIRTFVDDLVAINFGAANADDRATVTRLWLAGGIGLLAIVLSLLFSVRIGRSLTRRLTRLHAAATDLADQRLPRVVSRLRRGEEVDVDGEVALLPVGTDEIGELGEAFGKVQRTAIASAIDEAALRQGINEVFLNIARRSQGLLHRQLNLLDEMERTASDPEDLRNLFRADHLATRMRRHAEDLVILAGATPGRGWRQAVKFIDVIRGAVSEVEEYQRITLLPVPEASLAGRAVADIIHLLAELVENAASFSPPTTEVRVGGVLVPHGFAVEIEDRGLGMAADDLAQANAQLAEPPEFDPKNSARLGLFVVAQLAIRHGIRVTLRTSPYGGLTAVVLIPDELVEQSAPLNSWAGDVVGNGSGGPRHALPSPTEFQWLSADTIGSGPLAPTGGPALAGTSTATLATRSNGNGVWSFDEMPTAGHAPGETAVNAPLDGPAPADPAQPPPGDRVEPYRAGLAALTGDGWTDPGRAGLADPASNSLTDSSGSAGSALTSAGQSGSGQPGSGQSGTGPAGTGPEATGQPGTGPAAIGQAAIGQAATGEAATGEAATGPTDGPVDANGNLKRELPRRIRQTSLADQLRRTEPPDVPEVPSEPPRRTPEQLRSMMSAYQAGVNRSRSTGAVPPAPPGPDPARSPDRDQGASGGAAKLDGNSDRASGPGPEEQ